MSRTPQGARGLKSDCSGCRQRYTARRTPQGARGLKWRQLAQLGDVLRSHPARGAWIEIEKLDGIIALVSSRTPQGARGLKYR